MKRPTLRLLRRDPLFLFGAVFLALLILFAVFGPIVRDAQLRPRDPQKAANFTSVIFPVAKPFAAAGTAATDGSASLPLGADEQGRDIVSRLAAGARISLFVGLIVQLISLSVGICVGMMGIFAPKWVRIPLLRFTDGMFAFPDILLAILIIGIVGTNSHKLPWPLNSSIAPVIVALAITAWPSITRLVVTQVATLKDREYVVAARAAGASTFYLITRHILPQLWSVLLAVSMIELAGTILAESTLSFLGIGVQAPDPSWGSMINNARSELNSHPTLIVWPCVVLSLTIFALNFLGDGVRAFLDPKNAG